MKILQVAPYFTPYVGGQERYVHNLSKHLVKLGNLVDVATSNYPKSDVFDSMDGFSVRRFPCLFRPLRNPIAPALLELEEIADDYDVIHAHNEHAFSALIASYISAKHNIPLVLTCHGRLVFGNAFYDALERMYSASIARSIFRKADAVCALSDHDREYILSFGSIDPSKILEVCNGIDPELLSQQGGGRVREGVKEFAEQGQFKVLFVGSLIRRKGVETLVRAVAHALKVGPDAGISLIMVGDGVEKQQLVRLVEEMGIRDHVHLVGGVSDAELVYLYGTSDALALPSLSEGCPTVVLEAMYFGLPVIASDIPGIRDHFKETAWLVPPHDEEKLAESILTLARRGDLADWMRAIGRELVLRRYTWDRIAMEYQSIYERASGQQPDRGKRAAGARRELVRIDEGR